jgi:hypothetical protein
VLAPFLKFLSLFYFSIYGVGVVRLIVNVPGVIFRVRDYIDVFECLGYYLWYMSILRKQLGICYGLNDVHKFPDPGEYVNECEHGYLEIVI